MLSQKFILWLPSLDPVFPVGYIKKVSSINTFVLMKLTLNLRAFFLFLGGFRLYPRRPKRVKHWQMWKAKLSAKIFLWPLAWNQASQWGKKAKNKYRKNFGERSEPSGGLGRGKWRRRLRHPFSSPQTTSKLASLTDFFSFLSQFGAWSQAIWSWVGMVTLCLLMSRVLKQLS